MIFHNPDSGSIQTCMTNADDHTKRVLLGFGSSTTVTAHGARCSEANQTQHGQLYSGAWSTNVRQGEGRFEFANQCTYNGNWQSDRPNGRGVFRWPDGSRLKASWLNGKPEAGGVFRT